MKKEMAFSRDEMLSITETLEQRNIEYEVRSYISQSNGCFGERHYEITFAEK